MKRHVVVGKYFRCEVRVIEGESETNDGLARTAVTFAVIALCIFFLLGATYLGVTTGSWTALQVVWSVVGPIFGTVGGYYYCSTKG